MSIDFSAVFFFLGGGGGIFIKPDQLFLASVPTNHQWTFVNCWFFSLTPQLVLAMKPLLSAAVQQTATDYPD